jgi:hypothetical protein
MGAIWFFLPCTASATQVITIQNLTLDKRQLFREFSYTETRTPSHPSSRLSKVDSMQLGKDRADLPLYGLLHGLNKCLVPILDVLTKAQYE